MKNKTTQQILVNRSFWKTPEADDWPRIKPKRSIQFGSHANTNRVLPGNLKDATQGRKVMLYATPSISNIPKVNGLVFGFDNLTKLKSIHRNWKSLLIDSSCWQSICQTLKNTQRQRERLLVNVDHSTRIESKGFVFSWVVMVAIDSPDTCKRKLILEIRLRV